MSAVSEKGSVQWWRDEWSRLSKELAKVPGGKEFNNKHAEGDAPKTNEERIKFIDELEAYLAQAKIKSPEPTQAKIKSPEPTQAKIKSPEPTQKKPPNTFMNKPADTGKEPTQEKLPDKPTDTTPIVQPVSPPSAANRLGTPAPYVPYKPGFNQADFTAQNRAPPYRNQVLDNTGVDTDLTPEMQRSEYFQRMADRLNNRVYYRPGHVFAAAGQAVQDSGTQLYQRPQLQTEDVREQLINRARQGDKQAYQELTRFQDADRSLLKIEEGEQLNKNDIEKIRVLDDETLRTRFNINEAELYATMQEIYANVHYKKAFQTLAAAANMTLQQATMVVTYMRKNDWTSAAVVANAFGISMPDLVQALSGEGLNALQQWLLPNSGENIADGAVFGTQAGGSRYGANK